MDEKIGEEEGSTPGFLSVFAKIFGLFDFSCETLAFSFDVFRPNSQGTELPADSSQLLLFPLPVAQQDCACSSMSKACVCRKV